MGKQSERGRSGGPEDEVRLQILRNADTEDADRAVQNITRKQPELL